METGREKRTEAEDAEESTSYWAGMGRAQRAVTLRQSVFYLWAILPLVYWLVRVNGVVAARGPLGKIEYSPDSWFFPLKDNGDTHWNSFKKCLPTLVTTAVLHIAATRLADRLTHCNTKVRFALQAVAGLGQILVVHRPRGVLGLMAYICATYGLSRFTHVKNGKVSLALVWVMAVTTTIVNTYYFRRMRWFRTVFGIFIEPNSMLSVYQTVNFHILRMVSFIDDKIRAEAALRQLPESPPKPAKVEVTPPTAYTSTVQNNSVLLRAAIETSRDPSEYSFLNLVAFSLYLPLYAAGPIQTFNAFCHYMNIKTRPNLRWCLNRVLQISFMFVLMETVVLRLGFAFSIARLYEYWDHFYVLDLFLMMFYNLFFIWLRLKVLWDIFRLWSVLAGVYVTNNLSEFVYDFYSVRTFWKVWHHSFHLYLLRYIYLPAGGKRRPLLAAFLTFSFVAVWHVLDWGFVFWLTASVSTMMLEISVKKYLKIELGRSPPDLGPYPLLGLVLGNLTAWLLLWTNYIPFGCLLAGFKLVMAKMWAHPLQVPAAVVVCCGGFFLLTASKVGHDQYLARNKQPVFNFDAASNGEPVLYEMK